MTPQTAYRLLRWWSARILIGTSLLADTIVWFVAGPVLWVPMVGSPLVVGACIASQLVAARLRRSHRYRGQLPSTAAPS